MADSASELESDTSSIDGGPTLKPPSPATLEQLQKRIESLQQENRVLKIELETYRLKCKTLQEEKKELQKASVNIVSITYFCIDVEKHDSSYKLLTIYCYRLYLLSKL